MKQNNLIIAGLLCFCSLSAAAKEGDLTQELKISAASQTVDIKNNRIIFNGPVEVTQGSIKIHADELSAVSGEKEGNKILIAKGNPATYSQVMDDGRPAAASAREIRYELSSRTLTLTGNASLDQAGSRVTGNRIQYNIKRQQLVAESSGKGNDRVITIIQPESYQEDLKPAPVAPTDAPVDQKEATQPQINDQDPQNETQDNEAQLKGQQAGAEIQNPVEGQQ
jgi:lipopolysaccharide export system protein LptA